MQYNQYVVSDLVPWLRERFDRVGRKGGGTLTITNSEIHEPESTDPNFYTRSGETCNYIVEFTYEGVWNRTYGDGEVVESRVIRRNTFEILIPKMVSGAFYINGKLRLSVLQVSRDGICNKTHESFNFDYNRKLKIIDGVKYFITDIDDEMELYQMDELNKVPVELLELTETQRLKLQIKLQRDVGNLIDIRLIEELFSIEPDSHDDLLIDKKFMEAGTALRSYLGSEAGNAFYDTITKLNRNSAFFGTFWNNKIKAYFNMSASNDRKSQLAIPSTINPLSYDGVSRKIEFQKMIAYNQSMTDIIDIAATPINNSTNRLNELNKCARVVGTRPFITVYDLNFNKVELDYLVYMNSYIVQESSIDRKNKKIIEREGWGVSYKFRGRKFFDEGFKAQYIDATADEKLSPSTRKIPMINMSDSVRISMGQAMLKQSIELLNPEAPLLSAGHEEEDIRESTLTTTYDGVKGEVVAITKTMVTILDESDKQIHKVIPDAINGLNRSMISFTTHLEVGDIVSSGDPVVVPTTMKSTKTFDIGVNAYTSFSSEHGLNYEDAVIISESLAEKLTHLSHVDVTFQVKSGQSIDFLANIGDEVKSRSLLVSGEKPSSLSAVEKELIKISTGEDFRDRVGLRVPNNVYKAYISDINIYSGHVNDSGEGDFLKPRMDEKKDFSKLPSSIPDYLIGRPMEVDPEVDLSECVYIVQIRMIAFNKAKKGDKLANRYGSKGLIAAVLPDAQMPMDKSGRHYEQLLNGRTMTARKNPSQIIEMILGDVSFAVYLSIAEKIKSENIDEESIFSELKDVYGDKYDKYTIDELTKNHIKYGPTFYSMEVGSFTNMSVQDALDLGDRYEIKLERKSFKKGKRRGTKTKLVSGNQYIVKLYHFPEFAAKVTSSLGLVSPTLGLGEFRADGQAFGEMENWSMISHGNTNLLTKYRGEGVGKTSSFLNDLMVLNLTVSDPDGHPLSLRNNLKL